jgi:hypothetical protein
VDAFQLPPEAGSYQMTLDPSGLAVGTMTVRLWSVPDDAAANISVGGAAGSINIAVPFQNGRFSFAGTKGQAVKLTLTNDTNATAYLTLVAPSQLTESIDMSSVYANSTDSSSSFTLNETGTYVLEVDPSDRAVGNISASVGP